MVTCKPLYLRAKQFRIAAKDEIKLLFLDDVLEKLWKDSGKTQKDLSKSLKRQCTYLVLLN